MKTLLQITVIVAVMCGSTLAKDQSRPTGIVSAAFPNYNSAEHNVGGMSLGVSNMGSFGDGFLEYWPDYFTGRPLRPCQFPIGTNTRYLFAGTIWVGGVVGTDTLVSTGADGWSSSSFEYHPDEFPEGAIRYRSIFSTGAARAGAVSEQDFVATYFDTCKANCVGLSPDAIDHRPHKPLHIRVDQKTSAWSHRTVNGTVFFDLKITNIGDSTINKMYLGMYVDADIYSLFDPNGYYDDISGFFSSLPDTVQGCGFERTIPTAWASDIDGKLTRAHPVPNVTATALLNAPLDDATLSFNWWVSNGDPALDFGPTRRANHRDFGTGGTGTPVGDRNKYWMLGNGDIDYNQVMTGSILPDDPIWLDPGGLEHHLLDGMDTRYLLSLGPVDLAPGQSVPFVFAYVGGRSFHSVTNNSDNLPQDPWTYESNLGFADLQRNVKYASLVYDNPGIDTDTDGYCGTFVVCGFDTTWVTGDGVPDFRISESPKTPHLWVTPTNGGVVIRWNGMATERNRWSVDGRLDFEGYNVYLKKNVDSAAFAQVASYDTEDYFKAAYDVENNFWTLDPTPRSNNELRCLYAPSGCNDTAWFATDFTRSSPLIYHGVHDSVFYFAPTGCNASKFGFETPILKSYPDAPKPRWAKASDVPPDSVSTYLTDDGWFKYYEYQLTLENLTPADSYLVAVTALDYGKASLSEYTPLESPIDDGTVVVVPLASAGCCSGITGNVDCSPTGSIDIADLTALIDNLFISFTPLCCVGEANLDGDPNGIIDISDLTRLIDFLYISFAAPARCE